MIQFGQSYIFLLNYGIFHMSRRKQPLFHRMGNLRRKKLICTVKEKMFVLLLAKTHDILDQLSA